MATFNFVVLLLIFLLSLSNSNKVRYLTYTVNKGEGFNLRRDVYMRAASLVRNLRQSTNQDWILVLPPWPHLYHWKSDVYQYWLPWKQFFDLSSLNKYVPCIEYDEYIHREGHIIDEILGLQNLKDAFKNGGQWVEKVIEEPCHEGVFYNRGEDDLWVGEFFGKDEVRAKKLTCLSVQGRTSVMKSELLKRSKKSKSFLILRFEQLLHDEFGSLDYWKARGSMVYAKNLRSAGNQYVVQALDYDPGDGDGRAQPNGGGGKYLAVHLRRQDYQRSKPNIVPSLEGAAGQIKQLKKEQKLDDVFICSDAPESDKLKLQKLIGGTVVWFDPANSNKYGDGGVSIIDQWIAGHAQYFVGTIDSTFSYRIREDRQFMGFSVESTFNHLCGPQDNEFDPHSCTPPSKWLIVEEAKRHNEL